MSDKVESFAHEKLKGRYRTRYQSPNLRDFLEHPDQDLKKFGGSRIKGDETTTTTVDLVSDLVEECPIYIKRYNTKNAWHALRRTVRRSRAENCWIYADILQNLGVAIAPPVAFIQEYLGTGLKGGSWYLSKYMGPYCLDHLPIIDDEAVRVRVMEQIVEIMAILRNHHISHGDMKATNLLLAAGNRVVLLDLDAMKEHFTADRARTGINKDMVRFLQNWRDQPALLELAREKLQWAGFTLPN